MPEQKCEEPLGTGRGVGITVCRQRESGGDEGIERSGNSGFKWARVPGEARAGLGERSCSWRGKGAGEVIFFLRDDGRL